MTNIFSHGNSAYRTSSLCELESGRITNKFSIEFRGKNKCSMVIRLDICRFSVFKILMLFACCDRRYQYLIAYSFYAVDKELLLKFAGIGAIRASSIGA